MKSHVVFQQMSMIVKPLVYRISTIYCSPSKNTWLVFDGLPLLFVLLLFSINASALQDAPTILETKACGSCHVIPGVKDAYGKAGPSLKGLSERSRIAGDSLENNAENMRLWLTNPKSINPATLMPNMGLTDEEVQIVIEYLNTL